MHCWNNIFIYHNKFSEYMKVEEAVLEDVFLSSLWRGLWKILIKKRKRCLLDLFEKSHLELNEGFDDHLDNDRLCNVQTYNYLNNSNNLTLDNNVKKWGHDVTVILDGQSLYFEDLYFVERHREFN